MDDFLSFRRMITPFIIQVVYIVATLFVFVSGLAVIILGLNDDNSSEVLAGVGTSLLGPVVLRLYCEILIVVFRMNETLTDLRKIAISASGGGVMTQSHAIEPPG